MLFQPGLPLVQIISITTAFQNKEKIGEVQQGNYIYNIILEAEVDSVFEGFGDKRSKKTMRRLSFLKFDIFLWERYSEINMQS